MEECNTYSGCFDNSNFAGYHCDFNNKRSASYCSLYLYCDLNFVENNSYLYKLFSKLEPLGIEILANSSLNVSGDPTCFDLVDGLMV